jgi:hypothetical protein
MDGSISISWVGNKVDAERVEKIEDLANLGGLLAALDFRDELDTDTAELGDLPLCQVLGFTLLAKEFTQILWVGDRNAAAADDGHLLLLDDVP